MRLFGLASLLLAVGIVLLLAIHCFRLEVANAIENKRATELSSARAEWARFWMIDQPSHVTPERVHGGGR